MEALQILVNDVFNEKENYKEGDYLVIMNILKENYHNLNGDFDSSANTFEKPIESVADHAADDEGLDHYAFRDSDSDSDGESDSGYLGSYLPPY
tara:strand:- start:524 stop:805 length:282 start_codon:yes stop_codon:yes gene_type:complete